MVVVIDHQMTTATDDQTQTSYSRRCSQWPLTSSVTRLHDREARWTNRRPCIYYSPANYHLDNKQSGCIAHRPSTASTMTHLDKMNLPKYSLSCEHNICRQIKGLTLCTLMHFLALSFPCHILPHWRSDPYTCVAKMNNVYIDILCFYLPGSQNLLHAHYICRCHGDAAMPWSGAIQLQ